MKVLVSIVAALWVAGVSAAHAQSWEYLTSEGMNAPPGSDLAVVSNDRFSGAPGQYTFGVGMDMSVGRWYMTFVVPMPHSRSFSIRVDRNGQSARRTYAPDDFYVNPSQTSDRHLVSVWIDEDALEALMSGDRVTMTVGSREYRFPLTGSRRQISRLISTLAPIRAAQADDKAHSIAQAISDCDQMAANPWDNNREAKGVPWGEISASVAVETCRFAFENTEYPVRVRMQYQLGRALDKAEDPEALKMLFVAGENYGYAAALNHLAILYEDGTYSEIDTFLAEKFFRAASKKGNVAAMHGLADLLLQAPRSPERNKEAHAWLKQAVDAGYYRANAVLGEEIMFDRVEGMAASEALAVLLPASEAGNASASMSLATLYRDGLGVAPQPQKYLRYLKLAAQQGDIGAKEELGLD